MSTTKVIFTYKRKRLSSCSGVGNADVCPSFSSDGKNQAKDSSEKNPVISECVNFNDTDSVKDHESCPVPSSQHVESNLQETAKTSCNVNCAHVDGNIQSDSLTEQQFTSTVEVSKSKLNAPLLTFSRRLKKKAGEGIGVASKEEAVAVDEKSQTAEVASDYVVSGNMSCHSRENVPSKDSSYLCTNSSVTKQSVSALSGLDASGTTKLPKDKGLQPSDGELSSCDNACKTDEQHVSNRCRTSSVDSQLTSSDCADMKTFSEKEIIQPTASSAALDLARPPSGVFVIDCNVIPDCELEEKESDTDRHSSAIVEDHGKITQEGIMKSKGLELFADTGVQGVESSSSDAVRIQNDVQASVMLEKKPETPYLQLFSEDGRSKANSSSINMGPPEQPSRKAPPVVSLSLAVDPTYEGQTSRHYHNVGTRQFIQSPLMFQHNVFPNTCSTGATAPRGIQNISLDPGQPVWSEEELDSLWIGVRRHGRGNWYAMLLDPKLRFAPWRVPRDLAVQWDREQRCHFTSRFVNPRTHLSLGDVYARNNRAHFGQNESHIHMTLGSNPFNRVHASVTIGGGDGMGSAGPTSRYFDPCVPMSPPTGGPPLVRPSFNPSGVSSGVGKQNMAENVIVIDSDASSEETISDDINPPN